MCRGDEPVYAGGTGPLTSISVAAFRFTPQCYRLRTDIFFEVPTLQAETAFIGLTKVLAGYLDDRAIG